MDIMLYSIIVSSPNSYYSDNVNSINSNSNKIQQSSTTTLLLKETTKCYNQTLKSNHLLVFNER